MNANTPFRAPATPADVAPPTAAPAAGPARALRPGDLGLPSLRDLIVRHRIIAGGLIAAVVLVVAATVVTVLQKPSVATLADASTCSAWSAASRSQRADYARLYIREHPGSRISAYGQSRLQVLIDADCTDSAYLGESADLSIIAAINHAF